MGGVLMSASNQTPQAPAEVAFVGFFDDLRYDAAAIQLAALYPAGSAPTFSAAAAELLDPFDADERSLIGAKAIEHGANPQSVAKTVEALNYGGATQGSEVVEVSSKAPKKSGMPWAWLLGGAAALTALVAYSKHRKAKRR